MNKIKSLTFNLSKGVLQFIAAVLVGLISVVLIFLAFIGVELLLSYLFQFVPPEVVHGFWWCIEAIVIIIATAIVGGIIYGSVQLVRESPGVFVLLGLGLALIIGVIASFIYFGPIVGVLAIIALILLLILFK